MLLFLHKEMNLNLKNYHTEYELRKYYFTKRVINMHYATAAVNAAAGVSICDPSGGKYPISNLKLK